MKKYINVNLVVTLIGLQCFAEAFSCQPGDRMTLPEEKRVSIW